MISITDFFLLFQAPVCFLTLQYVNIKTENIKESRFIRIYSEVILLHTRMKSIPVSSEFYRFGF